MPFLEENCGMKWVTRKNANVDRVACPWLVKRFVDKDAEFLYVPADEVMKVAQEQGAIPYDVPGVELGHVEGRCSFESIIVRYGLKDPALDLLAKIVHGAGVTADRGIAPEAADQEPAEREGQAGQDVVHQVADDGRGRVAVAAEEAEHDPGEQNQPEDDREPVLDVGAGEEQRRRRQAEARLKGSPEENLLADAGAGREQHPGQQLAAVAAVEDLADAVQLLGRLRRQDPHQP